VYELISAGARTYYIDAPSKVGIYVDEDNCATLIDSGHDQADAKRVLTVLNENGWQLGAIILTHCHSDHASGSSFLHQHSGCAVYAEATECAIINNPGLLPSLVYGGYPHRQLRGRFLQAPPSPAQPVDLAVLPEGMSTVDLRGHSPGMIGVRTPDDVLFLGDALSDAANYAKYPLPFLYDLGEHLATIARLRQEKAAWFVPSHSVARADITGLLDMNQSAIEANIVYILDCCQQPTSFETLLDNLCVHFQIHQNAMQYALLSSTLRSYLSYLADNLLLNYSFKNGMQWSARLETQQS